MKVFKLTNSLLGIVGYGVEFDSGSCSVHWQGLSTLRTLVIYEKFSDIEELGHVIENIFDVREILDTKTIKNSGEMLDEDD